MMIALPVMVAGLVLVGGLAGTGGYGTHPALGAALSVGVAVLYTVYILMLRQTTAPGVLTTDAGRAPVAAPLFEATVGVAAGSLMLGLVLRDFRLGPAWPDLGWLFLLAMTSQVIGWLLITMSMSQLPAWLVSALLLIQPVGSLVLGAVFLGERPSPLQVVGAVVILGGVLIATGGQGQAADPAALPETGLVRGARPRVPAPCSGAGRSARARRDQGVEAHAALLDRCLGDGGDRAHAEEAVNHARVAADVHPHSSGLQGLA
jgi:uncharacterized membrane protein